MARNNHLLIIPTTLRQPYARSIVPGLQHVQDRADEQYVDRAGDMSNTTM